MLKWRINYWWILAIVFGGYMAMKLSIDPITWDSAVAVVLFLTAILPGIWFWGRRKWRKRTLFRLEYQHSQAVSAFSHEIEASEQSEYVQITLRMALETHVRFVAILFDGQGTLPVIKQLYDWQWGHGNIPPYVLAYGLPNDPEGRWYWRYEMPEHRLKGARVTIGVEFLATGDFNGHLIARTTCTDADKEQRLPFRVRKRAN